MFEGNALSSNDFSDALLTKFDELYTKAHIHMNLIVITTTYDAAIEGINHKISSLEYSKVTVIDDNNIELELL